MLKYCIELFSQIPFNLNKYSKDLDPDLELDPDPDLELDPDLGLELHPDPQHWWLVYYTSMWPHRTHRKQSQLSKANKNTPTSHLLPADSHTEPDWDILGFFSYF
jgi:hypothetical protein